VFVRDSGGVATGSHSRPTSRADGSVRGNRGAAAELGSEAVGSQALRVSWVVAIFAGWSGRILAGGSNQLCEEMEIPLDPVSRLV
jgi:hypothetical protein